MWQAAAAALSAAGDARSGRGTPRRYDTALDAGRTPPSFAHTARLVARSGYVLAPAAAILYVTVAVATGGRLHGEAPAALRDALSTKGVTAPAFVTHWRVQTPGDPPDEVDHFRFAIGNQAEREIEVSQGETVFAGYNALFSVGDLRDAVRADCELAFEPALLQRQIRVPCRARRPIDLCYLPGDPARFDIPAFPPHASALRRGFDWFRLLAIGVVWCLVGGAMNTWLAGGWTRLLLGVRA